MNEFQKARHDHQEAMAACETAQKRVVETRLALQQAQERCPHAEVEQPNYWKVCQHCGACWPGT